MQIRRLSSLCLPLLIVAVGVLLLLNTTGVVAWSAWSDLARFWPIAVILFGLALVRGHVRDRM